MQSERLHLLVVWASERYPIPACATEKAYFFFYFLNSTLLSLLLCSRGVSAANDDLEEWLHISTSLLASLSPDRATTGR